MRLATLAVLVLATSSCGNRQNPIYCDEQSDCSHLRGKSFCDVDALLPGTELTNTCVAPPEGEQCNRAQACTSPTRAHCSDLSAGAMGTCVECTLDEHCESGCDLETNTCLPPIIPCEPGAAGDADCVSADADRPYCAATDTCAPCALSEHCSELAAPVCDQIDFSCRPCLANAECGSLYCQDDTGECADTSTLIYVATDGTGNACTQIAPCDRFSTALGKVSADRQRIIVAAGDYAEELDIKDLNVEIVGIGTVRITPVLGDGKNAIKITGNSTVLIRDIEIRPSSAVATTDAVRCDGSSASLTLERSSIFESRDLGIQAIDCRLTLRESQLIGNGGGALSVTGSGGFSIVNSIIAHNVTTTNRPAIELSTSSAIQRFDFNTVVGNFTMGTTAGVTCNTSPVLQASSNIVYGNTGGTSSSGNCSWHFSDVETIAETNGNISADPKLVNGTAFGDYHLADDSPCINAGDPSLTQGIDIDGESRAQGAAPDMGADENS